MLMDSAMETGHENGSCKNASAEAESTLNSDPFQSFILSGDFENEERSRIDSDTAVEGVTPDGTEISKSPHSAPSSSSESDSITADDLQFNSIVFPNSNNGDPQSSPKSEENAKVHRRDVKSDVSIAALLSLEKIYGSSRSISQVSDVTNELPFPTLSQTQSPPVQMMERSEGYDPNRIPASIFISGSSTPMDWSANSNDSLFSLPIGNSLAGEQFAGAESSNLLDFIIPEDSQKLKESYKSGELSGSNELHSSGLVKIPNQVTVLGQTSPVTKEKEDKSKSLDLRKNRVLLTDQPNNIPYRNINFEDKANQEGYKNRNTIRHSVEIGANNQSSAFPVNRKSFKMACCLCSSNCSWGCCSRRPCWSCKWSCSPGFCCKWPSWSACTFRCHSSDCSSWKYTKMIFCCSCFKGMKDGRRRKWCSCHCCCPCCSSCSYSCC